MASLPLEMFYCTFAPLPNRIPFIAICALLERKQKLKMRLLRILYFGKIIKHISPSSTFGTKGNAKSAVLGKLEKRLLVQTAVQEQQQGYAERAFISGSS